MIGRVCEICNKPYKIKQKEHKRNRSKTCSIKCRRKLTSRLFTGEGNPFYGKKHKISSKQKQIKTLTKRYGVKNAYSLAKRRTKSKGQLELYQALVDKMPNYLIEIEKKISVPEDKQYFVDILIKEKKTVVEYNGDFWHCHPRKYKPDYWNPKKQKYAFEIWKQDKERIDALAKIGYTVHVVWESDFKANKKKVVETVLEKING